jgi:DNA polymerase III sliding clamp (beta) subunit (PCNA family)
LKRASKLSHVDFGGIIFGLKEDKLKLEVRNPDLGDSETEIDVEVIRRCWKKEKENKDAEFETVEVKSRVMLNPKYVLDAIVADGSSFEMAFMEHGEYLTPVVFYNDEADGFLGLVMPMRIEAAEGKEG